MPQTTIYVSPRSLGAPDTRPPAVATDDLVRLFGGAPALAGVSVRIDAARVVALTGPNGAGKTTLLRVLATLLRPTSGSAAVDGLDVGRHARDVRPRVAYLSHATGLYDDLTARENLDFAAAMLGTPEPRARVRRALADVGLTGRADEPVRTFSAGMRRRLAIGRILLGQASLVLLDEPYAALDADGARLLGELLGAWRDAGVAVVIASHIPERAATAIDGHIAMDGGLVTSVDGSGVAAVGSPATPIPVAVGPAVAR